MIDNYLWTSYDMFNYIFGNSMMRRVMLLSQSRKHLVDEKVFGKDLKMNSENDNCASDYHGEDRYQLSFMHKCNSVRGLFNAR